MKYCPACGGALAGPTAKYCGQCGADLSMFTVSASSPAEERVPPPAAPSSASPIRTWVAGQSHWDSRGYFNVEGGSAAAATMYFEECEHQCLLAEGPQAPCQCGRAPDTCQAVISGCGDGCYPVFELRDMDQNVTAALAVFSPEWAEGLEQSMLAPYNMAKEAKPVAIGTLDSDGVVYFSDSHTSWDAKDMSVDIRMPAGKYTVIAWLGEISFLRENGLAPYVRPMALGVYCQALADALDKQTRVERSQDAVAAVRPLAGLPFSVICHEEPQWSRAAVMNMDIDEARGDRLRALSWLFHQAMYSDVDHRAVRKEVASDLSPAEIEELLLARGQRAGAAKFI